MGGLTSGRWRDAMVCAWGSALEEGKVSARHSCKEHENLEMLEKGKYEDVEELETEEKRDSVGHGFAGVLPSLVYAPT